MITCRRAAELISRELDADLPLHQRVVLRFHKMVCGACRRFWRQLGAVDEAVEEFFTKAVSGDPDAVLPAASKEHLKAVIDDHLDGES